MKKPISILIQEKHEKGLKEYQRQYYDRYRVEISFSKIISDAVEFFLSEVGIPVNQKDGSGMHE